MQLYNSVPQRIMIRAAQDMLEHAQSVSVLGDFGTMREHPTRNTDTIVWRRVLPFGASTTGVVIEGSNRYQLTPQINPADFKLSEAQTPGANGIKYQDVSATLENFGILYKFSSRVELLYEDDVVQDMVKQAGETLSEVLELVRYGVVKAGSTVVYSNGLSRAAVNTRISLPAIRKAIRTLATNRARRVTQILAPSVNYETRAVEAGYIGFVHTDVVADIREIPGFVKVAEYGSRKPLHDHEVGSVEDVRFVASPLFNPYLAAGAAVSTSGMLSRGAANVDVYPTVIMAADYWGQIALRGKSAIKPTILPASTQSHANPMGTFGYVGANTWFAAVRLNDAYAVRIEHGVSAL